MRRSLIGSLDGSVPEPYALGPGGQAGAQCVERGLLEGPHRGHRRVQLQLGGDTENLENGDDLTFTESAVILERLIGKFIHNVGVGGRTEREQPLPIAHQGDGSPCYLVG